VLLSFSNDRYREEQYFARWFKSICYHKANEWKGEKHKFYCGNGQLPDRADASYNIEQSLENRQREILLQNGMKGLTDNERQIVILRVYLEMSFHEIAITRHITVSAARGMYCRAIKKVKQVI
jgi:RNA polymerase sigma factor (sigma-70 family)